MLRQSAIGLMSGSSLDGVDLAWCDFELDLDGSPERPVRAWSIRRAATFPYPEQWLERLRRATLMSGRELWQLHADLGHYFAELIRRFLEEAGIDELPLLVASHGHTVFHYPGSRMTTQIGDGAAMAAHLQLPVVDQFRSQDVALGGQGAPLAPLADVHLLPDYLACLNLGGIANLCVKTERGPVSLDIGGANQVFDALCANLGIPFDEGGQIAAGGTLIPDLLGEVNALPYYQQAYPKSLGNDWVQEQLLPPFQHHSGMVKDRLHTAVIHLAQQIGRHWQLIVEQEKLTNVEGERLLVTGGGAWNTFLCEQIAQAVKPLEVYIPSAEIINFKEAALMALAGLFRWHRHPNCFPSVTGASRPAIGGALHIP